MLYLKLVTTQSRRGTVTPVFVSTRISKSINKSGVSCYSRLDICTNVVVAILHKVMTVIICKSFFS